MNNLEEIVRPLYTDAFSVKQGGDAAAVMNRVLADDFQSIGSAGSKSKAQLIGQIQFFWKLVPDLKWSVQEMLCTDNRVIVRSIASGSPNGDFMGVPTNGSKRFEIMTIDIHTVVNGKIQSVHHLEDWLTAMGQLKA
jgi:steroid delta-isomerase-like uncharacterized protein